MEQSRRAVESYWRSRMIDTATSDEDKVTPVYKLEEICDLLRSSPGSIVKEVSDFILKRLDHKSPIVKQKALRIIKYAVGKSGTEFRREMQRHSIAVRQLIHYKGQPDPLKGDALNKAVRETAQETLSALFSSDEAKPTPKDTSLGSRIQGFGNTNYEMPSEDKRSFISEVVDIGSSTIKQGLSSLTQSQSMRKNNDVGTYRSPNLRRSLTREQDDYSDRYEGAGSYTETQNSSRFSNNAGSGNWGQDPNASQGETSGGGTGSTFGQKTREERLVETIVTSGGVRLQPTRDALHVFMVEASKLNALSLGHAIEAKLRSPMWQVRMKALCVLEAVLRKKADEHFSVTFSYFSDNRDVVIQSSESPQASLREKANKVLSLLGSEQSGGRIGQEERSVKTPQLSPLPDLIDTGDSDDPFGLEDSKIAESEAKVTAPKPAPLVDDLFGDSLGGSESISEPKLGDDPFADVSFHNGQNKGQGADPFSGMPVDKSGVAESLGTVQRTQLEPFDFFGSSTEVPHTDGNLNKVGVNDLMSSLSISGNDPFEKHNGSIDLTPGDNKTQNPILNGEFSPQPAGVNANPMFPMGYNSPPGFMFNPGLVSPQMNYGAMGNILAQQQQFLATTSNFQQLGHLQSSTSINTGGSYGGSSSPFPDIFNPGMATQPPTSLMNHSKRDDSKAFDFISDHVAAARDSKRVI